MLLIIINLKRQDAEHAIDIFADILEPIFLPCPNLWRDIVEHLGRQFLLDPFGNAEIEPRIVNQDDRIGLICSNILLATAHACEYFAQMQRYLNEAHICQLRIVAHQDTSLSLHCIASIEAELCMRVTLLKLAHQA